MSRRSIRVRGKLLLPVLGGLLLLIGVQAWLRVSQDTAANQAAEHEVLAKELSEFNFEVASLERIVATFAGNLANRPDVPEFLETRNREGMLKALGPVFERMQRRLNFDNLYVHQANGYVFLRVHEPDSYGDQFTSHRRTLAEAARTLKSVGGLEIDRNGLAIRGISPILKDGKLLGFLEVGIYLDQPFLQKLKERRGEDYDIWVSYEAAAPSGLWPKTQPSPAPHQEIFDYATTSAAIPHPEAATYEPVLRTGQTEMEFLSGQGGEYAVMLGPLKGYGGSTVGVVQVSRSRQQQLADLRRRNLTTLAVAGLVALLATTAIAFLLHHIVLRPLKHLSGVAQRQLEGRLDARVTLTPNDEYGQLGETFNQLSNRLAQTLAEQQQTIDHQKRTAESLRQTTEDLTRSNRDLEQFAYVASHDLQEPLRMVSSFTGIVRDRYIGQLDDEAKQCFAYVIEGADRMQSLIKDLLEYSRIGTRGLPLRSIPIRKSVDDAVANLAASIEDAKAEVVIGPLPDIHADTGQMTQLFQNLIGNAIKFRSERPIRIEVGARPENRHWTFWVKDNGIGIDAKFAERIFVIFQRLHTRQRYEGTGIGLAICKRIVERHGGKIWVESTMGEGATFYFTVPRREAPL